MGLLGGFPLRMGKKGLLSKKRCFLLPEFGFDAKTVFPVTISYHERHWISYDEG